MVAFRRRRGGSIQKAVEIAGVVKETWAGREQGRNPICHSCCCYQEVTCPMATPQGLMVDCAALTKSKQFRRQSEAKSRLSADFCGALPRLTKSASTR